MISKHRRWAHLVSELEFFSAFPKETWKSVLLQRYIIALLNTVCLMEVAWKVYALTNRKEVELRLYSEYYREILKLDFAINQIILEQDEQAFKLADIKDEVINPLIDDQYRLLALIAEQIANSEVEISSVKAKMDAFDARKRELAGAFAALRNLITHIIAVVESHQRISRRYRAVNFNGPVVAKLEHDAEKCERFSDDILF